MAVYEPPPAVENTADTIRTLVDEAQAVWATLTPYGRTGEEYTAELLRYEAAVRAVGEKVAEAAEARVPEHLRLASRPALDDEDARQLSSKIGSARHIMEYWERQIADIDQTSVEVANNAARAIRRYMKRIAELENAITTRAIDGWKPSEYDARRLDEAITYLAQAKRELIEFGPPSSLHKKAFIAAQAEYPTVEVGSARAKSLLDKQSRAASARADLEDLLAGGSRYEEAQSVKAYRDAYLSVLSEIRPFGGVYEMDRNSSKEAVAAIQEHGAVYPADWVSWSNERNERNPMDARYHPRKRAHYTDSGGRKSTTTYDSSNPIEHDFNYDTPQPAPTGRLSFSRRSWTSKTVKFPPGTIIKPAPYATVTEVDGVVHATTWEVIEPRKVVHTTRQAELTTDGSADTTMHELGHRMEMAPQITKACHVFRDRRAADERLSVIYSRTSEVGYRDGFASHYIGKVYKGSVHTEVFSCGVESLFAGTHGRLAGTNTGQPADPEHRDLILGLLAFADVRAKQPEHSVG